MIPALLESIPIVSYVHTLQPNAAANVNPEGPSQTQEIMVYIKSIHSHTYWF